MIRRMFLQMITGTSAGAVVPKINPPKAVKNPPTVEGGVEPMPSYPYVLVVKLPNANRSIFVIRNAEEMHDFEPTITDQAIKDLYYRNAQFEDVYGMPYKMAPYGSVVINSAAKATWKAPKGQSGEDLQVTF